jgi:hypothetical protein
MYPSTEQVEIQSRDFNASVGIRQASGMLGEIPGDIPPLN